MALLPDGLFGKLQLTSWSNTTHGSHRPSLEITGLKPRCEWDSNCISTHDEDPQTRYWPAKVSTRLTQNQNWER